MRFSIHTLGTRGDVQPYLALAERLVSRGHEVQVLAPAQFADMFGGTGIGFVPLAAEFLNLLQSPAAKKAIGEGRGFSAGFTLINQVRPLMVRLLEQEWSAAAAFRPEALVYHPKSIAAPSIAERLRIPAFLASPLPGFTPTSAFPSPMLPFAELGPLNKPSHLLAAHGAQLVFGKLIRRWRAATLQLSPSSSGWKPAATIYAYSRHVVPVPPDWVEAVRVSGYWFPNTPHWQPSGELAHFLASGLPPLYIGFGSMPNVDASRLTSVIVQALKLTGKRGLLLTGGGALSEVTPAAHVHVLAAAPHDRLFPLVSAAIHHGGAGTTGASLRAGLPTAICPFFGDQPFWGRRVAALGVGPAPLDRKRLGIDDFVRAIHVLNDSATKARAAHLGGLIRSEDGVGDAASFIEQRCSARA